MRDKIEDALAALLINSPGVILMTFIHYTWALVVLAVVLPGIVIAFARQDTSDSLNVLLCPHPVAPAPVPNDASVPEKEVEHEEEHELAGV